MWQWFSPYGKWLAAQVQKLCVVSEYKTKNMNNNFCSPKKVRLMIYSVYHARRNIMRNTVQMNEIKRSFLYAEMTAIATATDAQTTQIQTNISLPFRETFLSFRIGFMYLFESQWAEYAPNRRWNSLFLFFFNVHIKWSFLWLFPQP